MAFSELKFAFSDPALRRAETNAIDEFRAECHLPMLTFAEALSREAWSQTLMEKLHVWMTAKAGA